MLLLLPLAWLLERRQGWSVSLVLATSVVLVQVIPGWVYPVTFWVSLASVMWFGMRSDRVEAGSRSLPVDAMASHS
jgi:hypothetical protein